MRYLPFRSICFGRLSLIQNVLLFSLSAKRHSVGWQMGCKCFSTQCSRDPDISELITFSIWTSSQSKSSEVLNNNNNKFLFVLTFCDMMHVLLRTVRFILLSVVWNSASSMILIKYSKISCSARASLQGRSRTFHCNYINLGDLNGYDSAEYVIIISDVSQM